MPATRKINLRKPATTKPAAAPVKPVLAAATKLATKPAATKPETKLAAKPAVASGEIAALSEAAINRRNGSFTGNYPAGETANTFDTGFLAEYYKLFGGKPFNRASVAHLRFNPATCGQRNRGDDNGRLSRLPKLGLATYDKASGAIQLTAAGVKLASAIVNRKPAPAAK